jgi:hypothetical protein
MSELSQKEVQSVSGGRGQIAAAYDDIMYIHGDLVDRLSNWMLRTFG